MNSRWRPYVLGLLGLAALTFPFLWLTLAPDFSKRTMRVNFDPAHGLQFFSDLLPLFIVGFLVWIILRLDARFGWRRALMAHRTWQTACSWKTDVWAWSALVLVLAATFALSSSELNLFTKVGIYMLLALGLNITVGMTGLLVLGYAAFYGFGAYFFALMQNYFPYFPWWLAGPLAFFLGGGMGYLLGLPCLRLRGDYLAIVTLGFGEAFRELMRNLDATGSDKGIIFHASSTFHGFLSLRSGQVGYIVTGLVLFLAVFLVQRLYHSPVGRAWVAIRENEIAAASVGVPVVQMKLLAFSLSAAIAAAAGVIYGAVDGFVSPDICTFQQSVMILAMVILGGLGNSYGALLGAALIYLVPEYLKLLPSTIQDNPTLSSIIPPFLSESFQHLSDYRWLFFGAVLVIMMLYRPQGLLGTRRRKIEMQEA